MSPRSLALLGILSLGALAGCDGKIKQCNAFIDRANKSQAVIGAIQFESDDSKKLEADAAKVDAEAKGLSEVKLSDAKLVKLRDDYAANLTKLGKTVRDLAKLQADAKAGKTQGLEAQAKKITSDADAVEKAEGKIVEDINAYCQGK